MKNLNKILEEIRSGKDLSSKNTSDRKAVITKTQISARKFSFGVQFWTLEDIKKGLSFSYNIKYELVEIY
tara:strand:+ start:732 stop:941 length:210 start_codon:yes stop_codon:yes gene_type:complete